MTKYFTYVSNELLDYVYNSSALVDGFRYVRTVATYPDCCVVEFEDSEAPEEMEGKFVTPIFSESRKVEILTRMLDVNQTWREDEQNQTST